MDPSTVSTASLSEEAVAAPGPIDTHDANVVAMAKLDAIERLFFFTHLSRPGKAGKPRSRQSKVMLLFARRSNASLFATVSDRRDNFSLILAPAQIRVTGRGAVGDICRYDHDAGSEASSSGSKR